MMQEFLRKASEKYYAGTPILTDEEFDYLSARFDFDEIGARTKDNKVKHYARMYSLDKQFDVEPPVGDEWVISPKLDGAAVSLLYVCGKLEHILTRGDGVKGEEVTSKAEAIKGVPKYIQTEAKVLQITGEVVVPSEVPNARNYAAGALRLKEARQDGLLQFVAYGVTPMLTKQYKSDLFILADLGFSVVTTFDATNYPKDGVVCRINDNAKFQAMGHTARSPRGAYAIKQSSDVEVKETILLDVVWQVGSSGKVTPVAIFEPVTIGEAIIKKATLHNIGFIENLALSIGDTILITRSGGVIPKVVGKL